MTSPIPPREDLAKLIQSALFNARDLLMDARRLLDAGSAPRAHAFATLAFEEIGKANLCILVLIPPGNISVKEFWQSWRSHEDKLRWARALVEMIINEPADPLQQVFERLSKASRSDQCAR